MKPGVSMGVWGVENDTTKACSFAAKSLELGERIKSLTLIPSSGDALEVRANGKLLHSKLQSGE